MVLDMANGDASSATVRVLVSFYLVAINDTSSSSEPRRSIQKIQCSAKRRRTQRSVQFREALKTFTGVAEII